MNLTFFRSLGVYICISLFMHSDNNNVWVCAHMHMIFQTKRKTGIADEAARLALNQLNRNSASPPPKKGGKEKEAEKKDAKKGVRFVPVPVLLLLICYLFLGAKLIAFCFCFAPRCGCLNSFCIFLGVVTLSLKSFFHMHGDCNIECFLIYKNIGSCGMQCL